MRIRTAIGATQLAALAGIFVAACTLKSSAPFPDVSSFCTAKAQAECQVASTCGLDPTECQTQRVSVCNADANTAASTGSHTRKYTQANAQACIDAVNAAYGGGARALSFAQLAGPGSVTDVCERVFSGTAGSNQPCKSTYDCTGNSVCSPAAPNSPSLVCFAPTKVSAGGACGDPGSICAVDTYCAQPDANSAYVCAPAQQEGQSCASAPCVSAQRCEATGATGNTCEPRVGIGMPCTSNDDCAPAAPYCDANVGNKCEVGLSFATDAPDCMGFQAGGPTSMVTVGDAAPGD